MTLDQLLSLIENSNASDWTYIGRPVFSQDIHQGSGGGHPVPWVEVHEHDVLLSFKPDLAISIVLGLPDRSQFYEPWVVDFSDEDASSDWVDFRFNGVPVLRELRVLVDDAKAGLPCPAAGSMEISERQHRIWRLLDEIVGTGKFDEYFRRAGFTVGAVIWPP